MSCTAANNPWRLPITRPRVVEVLAFTVSRFTLSEIDRTSINATRRPRLEARRCESQVAELIGQMCRRRFAGATAAERPACSDVDACSQKRARGDYGGAR